MAKRKRVSRPIVERVADTPKPRYSKPVDRRLIDIRKELHGYDEDTARKEYVESRMKLDKAEL